MKNVQYPVKDWLLATKKSWLKNEKRMDVQHFDNKSVMELFNEEYLKRKEVVAHHAYFNEDSNGVKNDKKLRILTEVMGISPKPNHDTRVGPVMCEVVDAIVASYANTTMSTSDSFLEGNDLLPVEVLETQATTTIPIEVDSPQRNIIVIRERTEEEFIAAPSSAEEGIEYLEAMGLNKAKNLTNVLEKSVVAYQARRAHVDLSIEEV